MPRWLQLLELGFVLAGASVGQREMLPAQLSSWKAFSTARVQVLEPLWTRVPCGFSSLGLGNRHPVIMGLSRSTFLAMNSVGEGGSMEELFFQKHTFGT